MSSFYYITSITIGVILSIVADVCCKEWSVTNNKFMMFLGFFFYNVNTVIWLYTLRHKDLSSVITIWSTTNIVICCFIGIIFYNESTDMIKIFGLTLSIIGIVCVSLR